MSDAPSPAQAADRPAATSSDQAADTQPQVIEIEIGWKDSHALGLEPMDQTHREFVDLLATAALADDQSIGAALDALAEHTIAHFEMERQWMEETDFPPQHCHKNEHDNVLLIVAEVQKRIAAGEPALGRQLAIALSEWFDGHAATMDAMLATWMRERTAAGCCAPQPGQAGAEATTPAPAQA